VSDILRCFTLHAERLERDDVWRRTAALLSAIERHGGRATLFIHPFTAIEAGFDLAPRVRDLLSRGHEVAQHTHFYAPRGSDADADAKPASLFTDDNVRRCLDRDLACLRDAGADPRGFVAGGWAIQEEAMRWLRAHGFVYDASVRSFPLSYANADAAAGEGWTAPRLQNGLLRLPTTSPVSGVAKRRATPVSLRGFAYDMAYVHDYDLLRTMPRLAASTVIRRWGAGPWTTTIELARRIGESPADG
jgi:peptidoglycan/xylan/chitin deacetylase (PgdA/CDA1 family)